VVQALRSNQEKCTNLKKMKTSQNVLSEKWQPGKRNALVAEGNTRYGRVKGWQHDQVAKHLLSKHEALSSNPLYQL
jgi:hypothetical protein